MLSPVRLRQTGQTRAHTRGLVLITGASSGIGLATAEQLAGDGYDVLAGVRRRADAERLSSLSPNITPVMLDVTDTVQIDELAEMIDELAPNGLAALINNAGIGLLSPVEATSAEDWSRLLRVNIVGTADVTRAMLPSLIRSRGRIVNIGSAAGRAGFPLFGAYSTSKFGLEGFTDVLRREVARHGVKVTLMQPGVIATPIYERTLPDSYARTAALPPEVAARYRRQIDSAIHSAEQSGTEAAPASGVAKEVAAVLSRRYPPTRRIVGRDARIAVYCTRFLPDRIVDLIVAGVTRG